jgi:hypothetical protein
MKIGFVGYPSPRHLNATTPNQIEDGGLSIVLPRTRWFKCDAVEIVTCPKQMFNSLRHTKVKHTIGHSIPVPHSADDLEVSL